jgi:hypothetical protein
LQVAPGMTAGHLQPGRQRLWSLAFDSH